jgi:glycosyltransferase involved in cell wall biosynthesis
MRVFRRTPLVSVVLASYNHAPFVTTAVRSVIEQGIDELEIIVVDDGSTDGTPDQVENIGDPRIRLIRLEENRRYSPRNLALGLATGRYVAIQNSDDEWKPGKLLSQLEFMDENTDVSACFTGVEIIDEGSNILQGSWADSLFTTENISQRSWLRRFFDRGNCLCISSAVLRRDQVEAVGRFRASLVQLMDLDLWIRLAGVGGFHIDPRPLTRFRVVGEQNFSTPSAAAMRRYVLEYADVLERYTQQPVYGLLREAFGDVIPDKARSKSTLLAGLALHAWSLDPPHHLFADRVLKRILEDPAERESVVEAYGVQLVRDFIEKRGRIDVGFSE